jgi:hypothetical protein
VRSPSPQTTVVGPFSSGTEITQDFVGAPWVDSTFVSTKGICPRISASGVRSISGVTYTSNGVPLNNTPTQWLCRPYEIPAFQQAPLGSSTLAAMAVANMNPNRPDIDVAVSIAELRELPELLRDAAYILKSKPSRVKKSAKANLAAQFGIAPIIRDVQTLFKFAELVDRREKYLRELSNGEKRIKRFLTEENWDASSALVVAWHSLTDSSSVGGTNAIRVSGRMTRKYWYTARAKLLDPPSEREIKFLAPELVLGVNTITAQQLWNLVPWTWLIDWFSDTSAILGAYRGGLKWSYSGLNVMYKTQYFMTGFFPNPAAHLTIVPLNPNSKAETKHRIQPTVSIYPTWRIPYLTARQTSILSSLAILRL